MKLDIKLFQPVSKTDKFVTDDLNKRGALSFGARRIGFEIGDIVLVVPIPVDFNMPKVKLTGEALANKHLFKPSDWVYGVITFVNLESRWATVDLGKYKSSFGFEQMTPTIEKVTNIVAVAEDVISDLSGATRDIIDAKLKQEDYRTLLLAFKDGEDLRNQLEVLDAKACRYRMTVISKNYMNEFSPWQVNTRDVVNYGFPLGSLDGLLHNAQVSVAS